MNDIEKNYLVEKSKVVNVSDLNEKEISKLDNIRFLIKGILKALYKGKAANFVISSGFLYMVSAGIVEEYYLISLIYGVAFLKFTDFKSAYQFVREFMEQYKLKKEKIEDIMEVSLENADEIKYLK